jgi:hypothetical protein
MTALRRYLTAYEQHLVLLSDPILRKDIAQMTPQERDLLQSQIKKLEQSQAELDSIAASVSP